MHALAALIQFPEPSTLAIVGVVIVGLSIVFGLYGNDFVKKTKLEKATDRMHHQAVLDIYEDKKLSDEDAQYEFNAKISFHGESHAQWRLSHNTEKMNRTQSREHFRMRYEQNTNIGVLNVSAFEEPQYIRQRKPVTSLRAKITSLSPGGCAIVFAEPIARHVFLRVDIEIPDEPVMQLDAKIIATSNISGGRSLVRARFIATEQEERDLIARFLRKKQQATITPEEARK
jgi:hypothetical protein